MADAPIIFEELFSLPSLGIDRSSVTFSTVTMESDKYVCVRESTDQGNRLVIIDVANPTQLLRRPISADSAIMNPDTKVIALKAGAQIQLFDIGSKAKVKSHLLNEGEVLYWRWVSPRTLGMVTANSVYTWGVDPGSTAPPVKVFDRHASMSACQVINLVAGVGERWYALVGIRADESAPGGVSGKVQLHSMDRGVSQLIDAHAAAFCDRYRIDARDTSGTHLFLFASKSKFHVLEVAQGKKPEGAPRFDKRTTNIVYPPGSEADFPIALQVSNRYSLAFMLTKFGYIHTFDLESGKLIYMNRISESPVFATAPHTETGGIVGVNRKGQVLVFGLDASRIVEYVLDEVKDLDLAIKFAARNGLPGADDLFERQFNVLFESGKYKEAAMVAADSPGGRLRSPEVMQAFKSAPAQPGMPSPLLVYFQALLERGSLNEQESVELGRQVIAHSRVSLLERWIKENRVVCSEELGDMVQSANEPRLALAIYLKAGTHRKVIDGLIQSGEHKRAAEYARRHGIPVDGLTMIQAALRVNPKGALELAESLASATTDHAAVANLFLQNGLIQEATSYLLDVLKEDRPDQGELQTMVLEINLASGAPQVADAILAQEMFSHFDRPKVATLCERAGLIHRALELHANADDVKRVLVNNAHAIQPDFILGFFGKLPPDDSLELLDELLSTNPRGNLQLVVQVAMRYSDKLGPPRLIELFERHGAYEGLYFYLGAVQATSRDPLVVQKYIEAACRTQQWSEAERVTRESTVYDAEQVKEMLFELRPRDPRPLINVCDKSGSIDDLVRYFVKQNQLELIRGYVQRIAPNKTPAVVGALLDSDASAVDDVYIKSLLLSVKNLVPVAELTAEVERRNKLRLLLQLLETLVADGSQDPAVHTALAKVYVDANINPEHFLETNEFYDTLQVGEFCERRDALLAFTAYSRGKHDAEVLRVTGQNSMMREQSRYVVDRADLALWSTVLAEKNPHRRALVAQAVGTALPETKDAEKVSVAVRAFMTAGMQAELLELLEKLVLQAGGVFANNTSLQNLLILTAVKSDPARVSDYVRRLDAFDGESIAQICLDNELCEEAFAVYAKFEMHAAAVGVLIDRLGDVVRATEYATRQDRRDVWERLGDGFLREQQVGKAVEAFIRADAPGRYRQVVQAGERGGAFADVVQYLLFVRGKRLGVDEELIDNELIYCLARCEPPRLAELEELLAAPHSADLDAVGNRLFAERQLAAARLLFVAANNLARLAECLVALGEYGAAFEAARKADKLRTWKTVCYACVDAGEFRFAELCALHIVIVPEELDEVVRYYETRGYFAQIIAVLENGLGLDKAHNGMFTELAVLYTNYADEKLMEHLLVYASRCSLPKVIRAAESAHLWNEVCFAHLKYEEFDAAAMVMIEHAPAAWTHQGLQECLAAANSNEVLYRAVAFYFDEHPTLLIELLGVLQSRVDPGRILSMARRHGSDSYGPLGHLPLLKPYILRVQEKNVAEVNEALNEILLAEEDVDALRVSIERYHNFDQRGMAQMLERHDLLEMRLLALVLLRRNHLYDRALELCKRDRLFREAAETAAESGSADMAESLARNFLDANLKEAFAATLYTCYGLLRADTVMELSWRAGASDYAMPFFIQTLRDMSLRLESLDRAERDRKSAARKSAAQEDASLNDPNTVLHGLANSRPMLTQAPRFSPPSSVASGASYRMPPPPPGAPGPYYPA